jgi:hypothetical protein
MTRMSSRLKVKRQSKTIFIACVALTRLSCALAHALLSIGNHPLARGGVCPIVELLQRLSSCVSRGVISCPGSSAKNSSFATPRGHCRAVFDVNIVLHTWRIASKMDDLVRMCPGRRVGETWRPGPAFRLPCMPNAPRNRPHAAMCWWVS